LHGTLQGYEILNLSRCNKTRCVYSPRLCWARHATLIEKRGNDHKILVRRVLGKQTFGREANGRITLRWFLGK
jgi:hypothetical protein